MSRTRSSRAPGRRSTGGGKRLSRAIGRSDGLSETRALLAHEVRTPLAAIRAYADLLLESKRPDPLTGRQREHVASIRLAAELGLGVITRLLDQERAAAALELPAPMLSETVCGALAVMRPLATTAGASLAVDLPADEALGAEAAGAVSQILLNLVGNAIRHAGAGPAITVRSGRDAAGRLWIEVEDDGPGFASTAPARNKRPQGTGLGLDISRALAAGIGGVLSITAPAQRGARIRLQLGVCGGAQDGGERRQPEGLAGAVR